MKLEKGKSVKKCVPTTIGICIDFEAGSGIFNRQRTIVDSSAKDEIVHPQRTKRKKGKQESTQEPLPVHAALPQYWRRDCSGHNVPPLAHRSRIGPAIKVAFLRPLALESSQRILRIIKAPPSGTAHTILVKLPALRPCTNKRISRSGIRQLPVCQLSSALEGAIAKEH